MVMEIDFVPARDRPNVMTVSNKVGIILYSKKVSVETFIGTLTLVDSWVIIPTSNKET